MFDQKMSLQQYKDVITSEIAKLRYLIMHTLDEKEIEILIQEYSALKYLNRTLDSNNFLHFYNTMTYVCSVFAYKN